MDSIFDPSVMLRAAARQRTAIIMFRNGASISEIAAAIGATRENVVAMLAPDRVEAPPTPNG